MKFLLPWLVALSCLRASTGGQAELWTNVAGQAISAKLLSVHGEYALLQRTNGLVFRVPFASLTSECRLRAKKSGSIDKLPAELRIPFEQAQADIDRAAQFLHGNKITREDYALRCLRIRQRFENLGQEALKERGEESRTALLRRLDHRLQQAQVSLIAIPHP